MASSRTTVQGIGVSAIEKSRMGRKIESVETVSETVEPPETIPSTALHGEVNYACGATINLGDFESVRYDWSLKLPCKMSLESIDRTAAFAQEWVDLRLQQAVDATTTARKP